MRVIKGSTLFRAVMAGGVLAMLSGCGEGVVEDLRTAANSELASQQGQDVQTQTESDTTGEPVVSATEVIRTSNASGSITLIQPQMRVGEDSSEPFAPAAALPVPGTKEPAPSLGAAIAGSETAPDLIDVTFVNESEQAETAAHTEPDASLLPPPEPVATSESEAAAESPEAPDEITAEASPDASIDVDGSDWEQSSSAEVDAGETLVASSESDAELVFTSDKTITYPNGGSGPGDGTESASSIPATGEESGTDGDSGSSGTDVEPPPPTVQPGNYSYPPSQSTLSGSDPGGGSVPSYRDRQSTHISGMTRTRVSTNSVLGVSNGKARHQYSKRQAWNRDETLLMVGGALLDARDFSIKRKYVPMNSERNWSNLDPDKLFGIKHPNAFASYSPSRDQLTVLRTFSEYSNCTIGDAEGNISNDDRFVMLACTGGSGKYLVSYDIANDRILGRMKARGDFNWGSFTPSGKYIVVENNDPSGSDNEELLRFDPYFGSRHKLTDDRNHGDFGMDANGDDVYVMISWDVMSYIRIRDGARVTLGFSSSSNGVGHGHVSCRNIDRPGWCYFSAGRYRVGAVRLGIADSNPIGSHYGGQPLYRGVAEWEPWGYHRSSWSNYSVQPKASASWSGTKVIITSDWYGKGEVNDYVFEYTQ